MKKVKVFLIIGFIFILLFPFAKIYFDYHFHDDRYLIKKENNVFLIMNSSQNEFVKYKKKKNVLVCHFSGKDEVNTLHKMQKPTSAIKSPEEIATSDPCYEASSSYIYNKHDFITKFKVIVYYFL